MSSIHQTFLSRLRKIEIARFHSLIDGETWYVVSKPWYDKWKSMCSGHVLKGEARIKTIGPVDNSPITDSEGKLIDDILEGITIEYVPEEAWKLFEQWYGPCVNPFPRKVITNPRFFTPSIEVFPPTLFISSYHHPHLDSISPFKPYELSNATTANQVLDLIPRNQNDVVQLFRFDELDEIKNLGGTSVTKEIFERGRPVLLVSSGSGEDQLEESLEQTFITPGDYLLLLRRESNDSELIFTPPVAKELDTHVKGTLGLKNLGHTCFMNSGLQSIVHTPELTEYFLSGAYIPELNPSNPLSTGGDVAKSYASLLHSLFSTSDSSSSFIPRQFKSTIARHNLTFSGYAQQDTQEFIAFLLDALHEDLNRVKEKPYVERPDWQEGGGAREVAKLAKETWDGYVKRNDSVVVDLFQGLYKSTLECLECHKASITFDPFMYLTLPLPMRKVWQHNVHYVPWNTAEPHVLVSVELPQNSTFKDLKVTLAKSMNTSPQKLLVAELYSNRFFKYFKDSDPITDAADTDALIVYQLPIINATSSNALIIPVFHDLASNTENRKSFGVPFILVLDPASSSSVIDIHDAVAKRYKRWTSSPDLLDSWMGINPFKMHLHESPENEMEAGWQMESGFGQFISWDDREEDVDDGSPLLKPSDAIVCEWSHFATDVFFGENGHGLASRWRTWPKFAQVARRSPHKASSTRGITLDDCLDEFSKEEHLGEDNLWYCPHCKVHRQATKRFELWKVPDILVVHLKRFSSNGSKALWDKIDEVVEFPIEGLDLTNRVAEGGDVPPELRLGEADESAIYDLYAVDEHMGTGVLEGHYWTHARNEVDGEWYYFNDARVSKASAKDLVTRDAYLLFYRRRTERPLGRRSI